MNDGLGLRLFSPRSSAGYRQKRRFFLALYLLVSVGLTTAFVPSLWNGSTVLGLPRAFVWVVVCLFVMFFALVWLYSTEDHDAKDTFNATSSRSSE